jgi:peptidoglycan/LPS O-acetylase OafA/YrhL
MAAPLPKPPLANISIPTQSLTAATTTTIVNLGLVMYLVFFILSFVQFAYSKPDYYGPWLVATLSTATFPLVLVQIFSPEYTWLFMGLMAIYCTVLSLLIMVLVDTYRNPKDDNKNKEGSVYVAANNSEHVWISRSYMGMIVSIFLFIFYRRYLRSRR